ncbi:MAG: hypothetical protein RJQ09_09775 [Cyclobacteriaceae bacterium]
MIEGLPREVNAIFIITAFLTYGFVYFILISKQRDKPSITPMAVMMVLGAWIFLQVMLGISGFYLNFESAPPRMVFGVAPPLLAIAFILIKPQTRNYLMDIPVSSLTYLHFIRVPVEIVLWWLFLQNQVPELMTFEGRNYDILAGISAPFIAYFALGRIVKSRSAVLVWNFLGLGLVLNIVINAILSMPYPFQVQAFDQPNMAVFYFPFILLPAFIVPVVLFCHLASIIILWRKESQE